MSIADKAPVPGTGPAAPAGKRGFVLQVRLTPPSAALSDLPLLKGQIPQDVDVRLTKVGFLAASRAVSKEEADKLNELLPSGAGEHTFRAAPKGLQLTVDLQIGKESPRALPPVELTGRRGSRSSELRAVPAGKPPVEVTRSSDEATSEVTMSGQAPKSTGGGSWMTVHKGIGPLTLERIGLDFAEERLWLLFDGTVSLGGVTLGAQGLGLGVELKNHTVVPALHGLSVEYQNPTFQLAGAFVEGPASKDWDLDVGGLVSVSTSKVSLNAVGSYRHHRKPAWTSLFVFGQLGGELGGPPPFVLTGLCAGFGVNERLRVPSLDEIEDFPLLKGVQTEGQDPGEVLRQLRGEGKQDKDKWLTSVEGETWLSAGIHFTSFRFLDCQALLTAEFGTDLTIALLGICTASFPVPKDNKSKSKPYAQAKLELRALYQRSQGRLTVDGRLTPDSYLLSPDCVLHGGFAFHSWFEGSDHPGDFVYTVGGYHPAYRVPPWYPRPGEVGFTWNVGSQLSVDGGAYLALTPGAVMAGGHLRAAYSTSGWAGSLHAGFSVQADVLIEWSPFHFEADFHFHAYYRVVSGLLVFDGGETSGEVDVLLDLWGPPTGGRAHISVWKFSVDLAIGESHTDTPKVAWKEFVEQHKPWLTVVPTAGALPLRGAETNAETVVSTHGVTLVTHCVMPATHVTLYGGESFPGHRVDIRPVGASEVTATHSVQLTMLSTTDDRWETAPQDHWEVEPVTGKVPAALWSTAAPKGPKRAAPDPDQALIHAVTGLRLTAVRPKPTAKGLAVRRRLFEDIPLPGDDGWAPLQSGVQPYGPVASADETALSQITAGIADKALTHRSKLRTALKDFAPIDNEYDTNPSRLAELISHSLAHQPLITGMAP